MRANGLILTQIDITNAFNSVPHEIIINDLRKYGVNPTYRQYFKNFL